MDIFLNVVWAVGVVVVWYPMSELLTKRLGSSSPDDLDRMMGRVMGFIVALMWPLLAFVALPWHVSRWLYSRSPWRVK